MRFYKNCHKNLIIIFDALSKYNPYFILNLNYNVLEYLNIDFNCISNQDNLDFIVQNKKVQITTI